ncbi:MAG: hypothetical protein IKV63_04845, partial [Clostridia bacterium]|nr:hypothetical protein [Clostridia bacterium]
MTKKITSLLLAVVMAVSMLVTPASAFHVDYVSYSFDFSTGIDRISMLHIIKEDGFSTEDISIYDDNGNQLYIQTGP